MDVEATIHLLLGLWLLVRLWDHKMFFVTFSPISRFKKVVLIFVNEMLS